MIRTLEHAATLPHHATGREGKEHEQVGGRLLYRSHAHSWRQRKQRKKNGPVVSNCLTL